MLDNVWKGKLELTVASDKVIVDADDAIFVAFDGIPDKVDSVKGDRLVFNVAFDEVLVGVIEFVEVLVDICVVIKAASNVMVESYFISNFFKIEEKDIEISFSFIEKFHSYTVWLKVQQRTFAFYGLSIFRIIVNCLNVNSLKHDALCA